MEIKEYSDKYKDDFIKLNSAWIVKYFNALEEEDYRVFGNIEGLIGGGAMIFSAVEKEVVLATCLIKPVGAGGWEICKLAANEEVPHKGAGSAVFGACMEYARKHGAEKVVIETNSALKPAVHIYEKYGFKSVPIEKTDFARVDLVMEYVF